MNNFFGRKAFRHVAWKYRRNFLIAIISLLVIGEGISQTVQYSDDFSFLKAPDPLSGSNPTFPLVTLPEPEIGAPFLDPNFKTVLTRVTRTDGYEGRHEYSRYDPFNVDQSMIILVSDAGDYFIYKTNPLPFNQQQNHVMTLSAMEPRWDAENPNLLWAVDEFSIVTVDVAAGQRTIVKDFSQDPVLGPIITSNSAMWITWRYEGEASMDKRYWAFLLQADDRLDYAYINMFTWDRLNDEILGVYSIADNEQSIDWIGMSPLGNFVLIGADPWNGGNVVDLTIANKELTLFHQLANGAGHSDVGLDINGNEVIVVQNARTDHVDMIPLDWGTNPVPENGEYQGTGVTPLILLFYNSESPYGLQDGGLHISCNFPGYAVVSTHIEPGLAEHNWLDRSIVLVKLDPSNPEVFYLAKIHNTTQSYWEETHGTITNDGGKIVWATNWNQNVGQDQVFMMQLDMPPNWAQPVSGIGVWNEF